MRYEFSGSIEEIERFLVNEFFYSQLAAKIAAILLVYDKLDNKEEVEHIDFTDENKFSTPILNSRFDLSLTDAKTTLVDNAVEAFISFWVTKDISTIPVWFFSSMTKMIKYISDDYCCVYFAAIKWKLEAGNRLKRFSVDDILAVIGDNENYCIHIEKIKEKNFLCPFYNAESCNLILNKGSDALVEKQLNDLCDKKVLNVINETYDFLV